MRAVVAVLMILMSMLAAAPASARERTVAESLAIADRWAAQVAPGVPNYCAGGKLRLHFVDAIRSDPDGAGPAPAQVVNALGAANGWAADGAGGWRWDPAACSADIVAGRPLPEVCTTIAHELLHFVLGPEHVGPLAPGYASPPECAPSPEYVARRARRLLIEDIREALPVPRAAWRVRCSPAAARMTCRASNRRARFERVYCAGIIDGLGSRDDAPRLVRSARR